MGKPRMATSPDFHTGLLSSDEELVKRSERVKHAPIAAVSSHVTISADVTDSVFLHMVEKHDKELSYTLSRSKF